MMHLRQSDARRLLLWIMLFFCLSFLTYAVLTAPNFIITADLGFENLLANIRTPLLLQIFNVITILGSVPFVIGVAGIVGIFLWYATAYRAYIAGLVVTLLGAATTGYFMKILVGRARPSGLISSIAETSFSFPSGHATAAMALYGFLAYLLCALFPERKAAVLTAAVLLIGVIGFSRLYLGVHFPSDVLAGYLLGGLWLLIGVAVVKRMPSAKSTP
ncbi:MAG: phosphatase PAP2 family protein [Candidatus Kaiserbacteria bacterium]|nr:phosphatase PAP2 family protein [Candidatus Kaiserbacteria bacterium]